jgi:hypothetical protein
LEKQLQKQKLSSLVSGCPIARYSEYVWYVRTVSHDQSWMSNSRPRSGWIHLALKYK